MENKLLSKCNFFSQVLITFSIGILFLAVIGSIVGESAKEYSTMFELGKNGLTYSTIWQYLLISLVITTVKNIIFSQRLIKKMMTLWRAVLLLFCILVMCIIFIVIFGWFPVDNYQAWIGFLISFLSFFAIGTIFMILKTKSESRKYEKLFLEYKKNQKEMKKDE